MMLKKAAVLLTLLMPLFAQAELVIVTNQDSPLSSLNQNEVKQLFSGQLRSLAGKPVQPLDLPAKDPTREKFYLHIMGRTPEQMRAYWTRLIFTGQGKPPREVSSSHELKILLGSSAEYIGYIEEEALTSNMRVLYQLP
ncbi:hypothetical protein [Alcanivorax sp. 1008]|uniref:hypothetical protein n=1 Tax=Alcanivorax sp. 1008 TaxID=2816853 RepID=UPI001E108CCF|nr:hypothetical protein [Alcanivorax sp. 1008]MCC1497635.1 hypothetical protein [Alcanivorax sp. 1008]